MAIAHCELMDQNLLFNEEAIVVAYLSRTPIQAKILAIKRCLMSK